MDYKIKADSAYPKIKIEEKSVFECRLLMPAYGGRNSETTAIMTYAYQHYILNKEYELISEILEEIAIIEMRHHEMLGKAIVDLGGKPIIAGNYNYWQGGYVKYSNDINLIIDHNLMMEKKAIEDYKEIIAKSKCEEVKKLISRIILDEEVHIKTLTQIKESLNK